MRIYSIYAAQLQFVGAQLPHSGAQRPLTATPKGGFHSCLFESSDTALMECLRLFSGYDLIEWLMERLSIEDSCKYCSSLYIIFAVCCLIAFQHVHCFRLVFINLVA